MRLQRNRCAYCERRTGDGRNDGHIEHFRKQAEHEDLTVSWDNLYWSCSDEKTCGKHKDKCTKESGRLAKFEPDELIDPGLDYPERFLLFVVDGTVVIRPELDDKSTRRAEETLRVFQLAESAYLKSLRADSIGPYYRAVESLMSFGPDLIARYAQSQMADVERAPFSTAIRQYLEEFLT